MSARKRRVVTPKSLAKLEERVMGRVGRTYHDVTFTLGPSSDQQEAIDALKNVAMLGGYDDAISMIKIGIGEVTLAGADLTSIAWMTSVARALLAKRGQLADAIKSKLGEPVE